MNTYDYVFIATTSKPWICEWCSQEVTAIGGPTTSKQGVVHHRDHDHDNDDPENLTAMHRRCHAQHHLTGRPRLEGTRTKIGVSRRRLPDVPCAYCGKMFRQAKRGRNYCSPTCGNMSKRTSIVQNCIYCGVAYTTCPSGSKYCSPVCGYTARTIKQTGRPAKQRTKA